MSEKKIEVPVWTWRDAIRKARVPALTKHICNCIANYVSDVGEGAYPSVKALMADSGLSNRVVARHLALAEEAGLLHIDRSEPGADGRFKRSRYYPRFPDNAVLKRRADRISTPDNEVDDPVDIDDGGEEEAEGRVTESHLARPSDGASPGEPAPRVTLRTPPSDFPDANRVTERHSNSPVNYPEEELSTHTESLEGSPGERAREEKFDEVRRRFGQMLAELWAERPEAGYVIELFIGPLHRAKRRAGRIDDYRAFLADIRDGLHARDFDIATLERARQIAADDRDVMPSRPRCLAFCDKAKTEIAVERQAYALKRKGEQMRAADPALAARTEALHERLRNRLGRAVFDEWFDGLECRRLEGTTLVVSVPIKFLANWIRSHYEVELTECAVAELPIVQRVLIESHDMPQRRSA